MRNPALPASKLNPVGGDDLYKKAMNAIMKSIISSNQWAQAQFRALGFRVTNEALINKRYDYLIDTNTISQIVRGVRTRMSDVGVFRTVADAVASAYARGVGTASGNLSRLTDDYTRKLTSILSTQQYQRRVALIGARVFEEMQGFVDDSAKRLARVLSEGLQGGKAPTVVAKEISENFSVARSRARTIARTEITQALRRGRWDEARDTKENLGLNTALMHFSALSPTTRDDHAKRHGEVYTVDQVAEWYSVDANGINCKCTQVEVLLDANGNVIQDKLQKREQDRKDRYIEKLSEEKK